MQVRRKHYCRHRIDEVFFPVQKCQMTYTTPDGHTGFVNGYKALVNPEGGKVLSTVSDRYKVITNQDAYNIVKPIVQGFFGGGGVGDFECFNVLMPKTKASCRIDLIRSSDRDGGGFMPVGNDKWTAFVRLVNSYNRTTRLQIKIGFCRWICLNGCIFGENSYQLDVDHTDKMIAQPDFAKKVVAEALGKVGDVATTQKRFSDALSLLPKVPLTKPQIYALFFKAFDILYTKEKVREMSDRKFENLLKFKDRLDGLAASYTEEFGETAYAAFNMMTDFASYPVDGSEHAVYTPGYQNRVGTWLADFSKSYSGGMILSNYLGDWEESVAVFEHAQDFRTPKN